MNIVLAHGIFGFRTRLGIEYFNRLAGSLQQRSLQVLFTEVAPNKGIEFCGNQLKEQIIKAFDKKELDPAQKAHIIAHSKGGLESRFILSPANPNNIAHQIASLTTIGTPHQGSPVADLLYNTLAGRITLLLNLSFSLPFSKTQTVLNTFTELKIQPEELRDLTSPKIKEFNDKYPDHDQVRYFSVAGRGRGGQLPTCGLLLLTHKLVKDAQGDNDGLVSVESASRWEQTVSWPADHADEIGHDLDHGLTALPAGFLHLQEYAKLIDRLAGI